MRCWSVLPVDRVGIPHSMKMSVRFLTTGNQSTTSYWLCVLQFTHGLPLLVRSDSALVPPGERGAPCHREVPGHSAPHPPAAPRPFVCKRPASRCTSSVLANQAGRPGRGRSLWPPPTPWLPRRARRRPSHTSTRPACSRPAVTTGPTTAPSPRPPARSASCGCCSRSPSP